MNCYSEALLEVLEQDGVAQAMETLEYLGERDRAVRREGHMYAHAIGLAAAPSPDQVATTFRNCRPAFQSGCYHGVIQSYFAALSGTGSRVDAAATNALCEAYRSSEADRWLLFQCVHGMGHGLTMLYEHHLPSALAGCDLLADEWGREGCYGGAFMESIVQATAPHHGVGRPQAGGAMAPTDHGAHRANSGETGGAPVSAGSADHAGHGAPGNHADHAEDRAAAAAASPGGAEHLPAEMESAARTPFPALNREDPLYPCSVLEARYLVACYQMQTSAILFYNGGDLAATAAACDRAPEQYRGHCYQSLGRDVSALTVQDHEAARTSCEVGDPEYRVYCHIGYVKNLVDLTADPLDAFTYCRGSMTATLKQACYHAVGEEIWVLTSNRRQGEDWCATVEEGHREHCRRGAGLASWREEAAG
jgi:hypothetical protein